MCVHTCDWLINFSMVKIILTNILLVLAPCTLYLQIRFPQSPISFALCPHFTLHNITDSQKEIYVTKCVILRQSANRQFDSSFLLEISKTGNEFQRFHC